MTKDDDTLDEVFSTSRDRGGNEAPPEPEAEVTPVTPETPVDTDPKAAEPEPAAKPDARHVPLSELLAERGKTKEARAAKDSMELRLAELERRLASSQTPQQQQGQQGQTQVAKPKPDFFENPEAFVQSQIAEDRFQARNRELAREERSVRKQHGDALVNEAFAAAQQTGMLARFQQDSDAPWEDCLEWYTNHKALTEIGDPSAYRERVRQEVLAELKAGTAPKTAQRLTGTLASATAAGNDQTGILTDEAMMGQVFGSNRRRG